MDLDDISVLIQDSFESLHHKVNRLMTSNQDVMDAIKVNLNATVALEDAIKGAIVDMGTGGDAARAAMVEALKTLSDQLSVSQKALADLIASHTSPPLT